jgi:hypothetical protein
MLRAGSEDSLSKKLPSLRDQVGAAFYFMRLLVERVRKNFSLILILEILAKCRYHHNQ